MPGYDTAMRRYAQFSGRSARSEFWMFTLVSGPLLGGFAMLLDGLAGTYHRFFLLVFFVHLIPSIAVSTRRLHDTDRTGWWYLLVFTVIGALPLIAFYCDRGTAGANRYGAPDTADTIVSQPQTVTGAPMASPPARDLTAELERLAALRQSGALTDAEFATMKARALGQTPSAANDPSA